MKRVRTVEGSCWSCKGRRVKCDLAKPSCGHCQTLGAECVYGSVRVRWSTRPNAFQARIANAPGSSASSSSSSSCELAVYQKRALEYFMNRLWPLFTSERVACPFPVDAATRDRTMLQAVCVISDAHRCRLDRRNSESGVQLRRIHVLASINQAISRVGMARGPQQIQLLYAVLLLYFLDGYIDCKTENAATLSHQMGIRAIINSSGGYQNVLASSNDALCLLISEFVAADLSSALFRNTEPFFPPETWPLLSTYRVWWASDKREALKLGMLFQKIAAMIFYGKGIQSAGETASPKQVEEFEADFSPIYTSVSSSGQAGPPEGHDAGAPCTEESLLRGEFLRAYQHCASIYLYRVICRYPAQHSIVQQHVYGAISKIVAMDDESKLLDCVLLPLCVAGAHLRNASLQRTLFHKLDVIHRNLKFESVGCIKEWITGLWSLEALPQGWTELFQDLNPQAVVI
ncbi:hypothetical protein NLU13_9116 [Sarocladium strictum]|uniref:Zn(2)-C6 fungal-type domain-containing protein n=1 Tax=Sarocladium strictum TaxID=5046 RepID=A0AA39GAN1_SARSR|nr:hypothetical protein NLU13_9116 [Sarocladium strictum]